MERGEGGNPDAHDVVHSTHFTAEDFDESRQLKPMAVPTIFDMHENVKPQTCNNNGQSYTATCSDHDVVALTEHHNYSNTSPRNFKHKLDCAEDNVLTLSKQLKKSKRLNTYYKARVKTLKKELKKKNLLSKELKKRIEIYKELPLHLLSKPEESIQYSDEQISFALTLHYYGPKAYEYLATKFHLPSTRTLR
ncbi:THAP domain-containing protein 6, partial [Biomphalaria pfeifferi]